MCKKLHIADALFDLPGEIRKGPINDNFQTFWTEEASAKFHVKIRSVRPNLMLSENDGGSGRSFRLWSDGSSFHAVKRTTEGAPLWSLNSMKDLSEYELSYNPDLFCSYYHSLDDLICREPGLLILVLYLCNRGGLVFHGSASVLEDNGILCVGRSGVGKSTISRILNESGATILSCERPVVRLMPSQFARENDPFQAKVYGTPWPNVGGFALNDSAPLKRIYFLEQDPENRITPLTAKEALPRLIQFANILWDHPKLLDPCLQTVETLLANVPAAVLSFRPDEEVVDVIRQDLAANRSIS